MNKLELKKMIKEQVKNVLKENENDSFDLKSAILNFIKQNPEVSSNSELKALFNGLLNQKPSINNTNKIFKNKINLNLKNFGPLNTIFDSVNAEAKLVYTDDPTYGDPNINNAKIYLEFTWDYFDNRGSNGYGVYWLSKDSGKSWKKM